MFIPNSKISRYLSAESVGFWVDYAPDSKAVGLVCKLPLMILKSILLGAKVDLHFMFTEIPNRYLTIGVTVHDVEDNPSMYVYPIRDKIEIKGLNKLLEKKRIEIAFYDDFSHPAISCATNLPLEFIEKLKILKNKGFTTVKDFFIGHAVTESCFKALHDSYESSSSLPTSIASCSLELYAIKSLLIGAHESVVNKIYYDLFDGKNGSEGYIQEDMIKYALSYLFMNNVVSSPMIREGNKDREFTDIAVFDNNDILLIESKASAIIEKGRLTNSFRRESGTSKLIKKAISQVEGVSKLCHSGVEVNIGVENTNIIDSSNNIHIFIVVTELIYLDQEPSFNELTNKIYDETGCKVQVVDLSSLINIIKLSRGIPKAFWKHLEGRFELSYYNKTYNIRDIDSSLPVRF